MRRYTSLCWSVGFTFSAFFSFFSLLLLLKCPSDLLQHRSYPPARDWGSRVSGLVFLPIQCFFFSFFQFFYFPQGDFIYHLIFREGSFWRKEKNAENCLGVLSWDDGTVETRLNDPEEDWRILVVKNECWEIEFLFFLTYLMFWNKAT